MNLLFSLKTIILSLSIIEATNQWPNHDISTLKLVQLVHRHGDRAPVAFPANDPYNDIAYWPEGIGELTSKGKYRMYRLGQFVRQEYDSYLGNKYSPREVYARSSSSHRCVESLSTLLAGAYPPKHNPWISNTSSDSDLATLWQPIPIETFIPQKEDLVLEQVFINNVFDIICQIILILVQTLSGR